MLILLRMFHLYYLTNTQYGQKYVDTRALIPGLANSEAHSFYNFLLVELTGPNLVQRDHVVVHDESSVKSCP